jgi:hypothetical protein
MGTEGQADQAEMPPRREGEEPSNRAGSETGDRGGILINFGNSGKIDPEEIPGQSRSALPFESYARNDRLA